MTSTEGRNRPALSASRAVGALNYFTANPQGSYTLSELSTVLDVSPASMTAVLRALTDAGYLVRHHRRKTYELGPALVAAGHAASLRHPVVELARPEMRRLAERRGECVGSVVVGEEILLLAVEGRPTALSYDVWLGQRLPLVPPMGQVFMAWSSQGEVDRWLARGGLDLDERVRSRLMLALSHVRERGYAIGARGESARKFDALVDRLARRPLDTELRAQLMDALRGFEDDYAVLDAEPECEYSLSNLAAPVFDADGSIALALTLPGLADMTGHEISRIAAELTATTRLLTRQLGGRAPLLTEASESA